MQIAPTHCHGPAGDSWWHSACDWSPPPASAVDVAAEPEPIASEAAMEAIVAEFVAIDPMSEPTTGTWLATLS